MLLRVKPCPSCGAADTRVKISLDNLIRLHLNILLLITLVCTVRNFLPFTRTCKNCHQPFRGRFLVAAYPFCLKCGYNLRGAYSNKCSECGWPIPPEYRQAQTKYQ